MTTDTALGVTKRVIVDRGSLLPHPFPRNDRRLTVLHGGIISSARGDSIRCSSFLMLMLGAAADLIGMEGEHAFLAGLKFRRTVPTDVVAAGETRLSLRVRQRPKTASLAGRRQGFRVRAGPVSIGRVGSADHSDHEPG